MAPDPKPVKRYRASLDEWTTWRRDLADNNCWVCDGPWQELHHIYPRSQGGDDDIDNLAPLCRPCHGLVEAHDPYARSQIRGALLFNHTRYLERKTYDAVAWLQRQYPLLPARTEP